MFLVIAYTITVFRTIFLERVWKRLFVSCEFQFVRDFARIRTKYTAKWGLQIAEMFFQTHSSILTKVCGEILFKNALAFLQQAMASFWHRPMYKFKQIQGKVLICLLLLRFLKKDLLDSVIIIWYAEDKKGRIFSHESLRQTKKEKPGNPCKIKVFPLFLVSIPSFKNAGSGTWTHT